VKFVAKFKKIHATEGGEIPINKTSLIASSSIFLAELAIFAVKK
jgi:hypothetical protein